jgi:Protein of unknown function (DUF1566)
LVDWSQSGPAIDESAFPNTQSDYRWSSSLQACTPGFSWYLYFGSGQVSNYQTNDNSGVRCVR